MEDTAIFLQRPATAGTDLGRLGLFLLPLGELKLQSTLVQCDGLTMGITSIIDVQLDRCSRESPKGRQNGDVELHGARLCL